MSDEGWQNENKNNGIPNQCLLEIFVKDLSTILFFYSIQILSSSIKVSNEIWSHEQKKKKKK